MQALQGLIGTEGPGLLGIAVSQNWALAAETDPQTGGETASEELWVLLSNGDWDFIARVGGAFSSEVLVHEYNVPASIAPALIQNLDAMNLSTQ